jgi:16S rRNA (uracil1498-N3)-methyltransferase
MSPPRLHVAEHLASGQLVPLEGDRAHYLRTVLRLRDGAEVRVFNDGAGEWSGRLAVVGRHKVEIRVERRLRPSLPEPGATLAFAPIRRNRLDWLVEKAVELGVARLVPVLTERGVVRPDNTQRLAAIAVEAAEQCERLTVPTIDTPRALANWLAVRDGSAPLLFAEERGGASPLFAALRRWPGAELLVGPEGGFSERELAMLHAVPVANPVSLGRLILRAETAALYCLVTWQLARLQPSRGT